MNNSFNYDNSNAKYDAMRGFGPNHNLMDAKATVKSGLPQEHDPSRDALGNHVFHTKTRASLLGIIAGGAFSGEIMRLAAERDEEMMRVARDAINQYCDEVAAFEGSITAGELMISSQVQAGLNDIQPNLLNEPGAAEALIAVGGGGVLIADLVNKIAEKLPPKYRPVVYSLVVLGFAAACGLGFIPSVVGTVAAPAVEQDPKVTIVAAKGNGTATNTPRPTNTATKEPKPSVTPSATVEATPLFLKNYLIEYGNQNYENGSIHGVLDQSETIYPKADKGVMYKGSTLFGFTKVFFTDPDTKLMTEGYVVEGICTPVKGSFYCYVTSTDTIFVVNEKPSLAFFKGSIKDLQAIYPDNQPTVKLDFSSTIPGLDEVFNNVFGESNGKLKWIEIPGVGKVLNVRHLSEIKK